jgi:hypothetical protein
MGRGQPSTRQQVRERVRRVVSTRAVRNAFQGQHHAQRDRQVRAVAAVRSIEHEASNINYRLVSIAS